MGSSSPTSKGKGGRSRTVPLGEDVAEAARAHLHTAGRSLGDPGRLFLAEVRAASSSPRTGGDFLAEDRAASSRDVAGITPSAVFLILRRLVERPGFGRRPSRATSAPAAATSPPSRRSSAMRP